MSDNKYLDNMNIQYSPEEKEDDYDHNDSNKSPDIQNNPELKRGIIARFMDSKIDTYNDRINSLKEENVLLRDKINRNVRKISYFESKMLKLDQQITLLKSMAKSYPSLEKAVNILIDKNIKKITKIDTEKIPAKRAKIIKHKVNIDYNNDKICKLELKIKTCNSIKNYFHSFTITNDPLARHTLFMDCLNDINESFRFKQKSKLKAFKIQLNKLHINLDANRYMQKQTTNTEAMEWLKSKEKSYINKISKLERKIEKINTKLEKYQTLSQGIQGIESEPPANKSQHIEEMMSKNESFNNSLAEIVVNLSEGSIADRVILSNAAILSDLNIHISRTPVQTEKSAAEKENIPEKQNNDSVKSTDKQPIQGSKNTQQTNKSAEKHSVKNTDKASQNDKKSLLGELRHNQDKIKQAENEKNKTADLSKTTSKTAEVSLS